MSDTPPATHLGWWGRTVEHSTDLDLGRGSTRGVSARHGIKRVIWDAAFGYVSGIPLRAIAYYLITRSFHPRVERWAMEREGIQFVDGYPVATIEYR